MEAFTAQCADPRSHQLAVLARLLSLHRDVDLLRRHGVRVPDSLSAPVGTADGSAADAGADAGSAAAAAERGEAALCLLRRLPLTSYAAYAPLIEEAVEAGRAFAPDDPAAQARWDAAVGRLSGAQPVYAFWCSSGTTGAQKRLPASLLAVESNMRAFAMFSECTAAAFPGAAAGKELRFSYAREVETLPNGAKVGVASSINYRRWVATYQDDPVLAGIMARWCSPPEVVVAGDARTAYYLHLLCALTRRHEVVVLSDIFAAALLLGASILVEHWGQLMADIRAGRCFSWLDSGSDAQQQQENGCTNGTLANGSGDSSSACAGGAANGHAPRAGAGHPGGDAGSKALPPPPADVAAAVNARLEPNPGLAEELQLVFEGGRRGLLERLFPSLLNINAVMTGSMSKYVPHLRELAPRLPFLSSAYGATEGMFGVQADLVEYWAAHRAAKAAGEEPPTYAAFPREPDGESSYVLLPTTDCFFEFIPLDDDVEHTAEQQQQANGHAGSSGGGGGSSADAGSAAAAPATLTLDQLQAGRRYELVVSNMLGLFRYRVGDVLRCVGHYHRAPKVVVEGRTGQALNLAGEKLPEAGVVAAVRAAAAALLPRGAASLRDWAAREALHPAGAAGDSAGHYTFYWELSEGEAAPEPAELARWAAALDGALLQAAPAYGTVRGGMVQPLHLKLVAGGAFDGIRQLAYAAGATAAQYKPPVVLGKTEQQALMEARVLAAAVAEE